jgi:hypothetical protein
MGGGMLISDKYIIIFTKRSVFMKNTNKYLTLGVALVIALFASVQVSAMVPGEGRKNPHLNSAELAFLENTIRGEERLLQQQMQLNTPAAKRLTRILDEHIKTLKSMYYGNRPYTADELMVGWGN